jgi:hypothetical protein
MHDWKNYFFDFSIYISILKFKFPKFQIDISNSSFFSEALKKALRIAKFDTKLTLRVNLFFKRTLLNFFHDFFNICNDSLDHFRPEKSEKIAMPNPVVFLLNTWALSSKEAERLLSPKFKVPVSPAAATANVLLNGLAAATQAAKTK